MCTVHDDREGLRIMSLARAYAEGAHIQAESLRAAKAAQLSLAERMHALDEWIGYGGFLPAAWAYGRTS